MQDTALHYTLLTHYAVQIQCTLNALYSTVTDSLLQSLVLYAFAVLCSLKIHRQVQILSNFALKCDSKVDSVPAMQVE